MKSSIQDREALTAVSPAALSAYARAAGWTKVEMFGDHSDVYIASGLPEIILPRTQSLGDYSHVVSQLISIFAAAADVDEIALYRDLVTSDRDVIRVRAEGAEDGAVAVSDGIDLLNGAHDMLLAAACSLDNPRPLYRAGANKEASEYLSRVRLGQTEQGSFAITLMTPVVPPPMQLSVDPDWVPDQDPIERRVTRRLADALAVTRFATEGTNVGDTNAFHNAVKDGASANLCEALVKLIDPFPLVDVSLVWARTRPRRTDRDTVRFTNDYVPVLREAARSLRSREPRYDTRLFGNVHRLKRDDGDASGTVSLRTSIDRMPQSVSIALTQSDYDLAIFAHGESASVIVEGDLEQSGQRWILLNPSIVDVIPNEEPTGSDN